MIICFWPDGCWAHIDELSQMTHKSDDYATIELPDEVDEHTIDCIIFNEVSR